MSELLELQVLATAPETVEDALVAETTSEEVVRRIHELKEALRDTVVILGHHYQRDDIVQFADRTGDSFELARYASELQDRDAIRVWQADLGDPVVADDGASDDTRLADDGFEGGVLREDGLARFRCEIAGDLDRLARGNRARVRQDPLEKSRIDPRRIERGIDGGEVVAG